VQKNLSGAFLKKVLVPVPPLDEQDRVVEVFGAIHEMGTALDEQQLRLNGIRAALLREVFAGGSVPQADVA
jgi:restriction endonuclease S subunit